jgi:hypothetical protein
MSGGSDGGSGSGSDGGGGGERGGSKSDGSAGEPAWQRFIDRSLVDRCERHVRRAERRGPRPLPVRIQPPELHLDPAQWGVGFLAVHERTIPWQLSEDLRQLSPQALLRDLHRPEMELRWVSREPIEGTDRRAAVGALTELRALRQKPELPRIESLTRVMRAYQTFRRHLVDERWEPALPDDAPRRPVSG